MAKVIGTAGDSEIYIMEVEHRELEKFMGLYYGKMDRIKVGDVVDLASGHDHAGDIREAFAKTQAFIEANAKTINAINNGLTVLKNIPKTAIKKIKNS